MTSIGQEAFSGCGALNAVRFQGSAPQFTFDAQYGRPDTFKAVNATVYYPQNDTAWTEEVRQQYGGTLTWAAYGAEEPAPENPAPEDPAPDTAGKTVEELVSAIESDPTDGSAAEALVEKYKNHPQSVVSADATAAMRAVLETLGKWVEAVLPADAPASAHAEAWQEANRPALQIIDLTVSATENRIEITAEYSDKQQSSLGAYLIVHVPQEFDTSLTYLWHSGNQSGHAGAVKDGSGTTFSFFAPHFSTYTIEAVSKTPAPTPEAPAAPAPASPILKTTGADVNTGIVPVLALAGVLTLGCAVAVKKRIRNQ